MNPNTLEHWANRGWMLDATLFDAPGEVVNTGGGPYYVGEEKEVGLMTHWKFYLKSKIQKII